LLRRRETRMNLQEPQRNEERGRVVPFRPRQGARRDGRSRPLRPPWTDPGDDDLSQYERDLEAEDHRRRMRANLLAFAVLCVIVAGGIWLAGIIAQMQAGLDCSLTGRTNCAPIPLPPVEPR
jgi:hypothetical protein